MPAPAVAAASRLEWAQHWQIPLVCASAAAVSVTHLSTLGVLLPHIRQEYGWPAAQISAGLLILSITALLLSGFVGAAVDRWGSRRIGLAGLCLYCAAFAGLATTGPSIWNWWLLWLIISCGYVCITGTVWTPAIASRFFHGRGLAFAVMLCGNGVSAAVLPILTTILLERYGWRGACVGIGLIDAAIALPLIWLFFKDHPRPVGDEELPITGAPKAAQGFTLREALSSPSYLKIAAAGLIFTIAGTALVVHFVPILRETGFAARAAAWTAGGIGIGVIAGRLVTGILLDRIHGPLIGGFAFSLPAVACLLLLSHPGQQLGAAIALIIGLALGSEVDVVAYVLSRYFGLHHLGAIFGTIVGLLSLGAGIGPLLSGIIFDAFGSYERLIMCLIPLFLISAGLIASLGPYPPHRTGP